MSKKIREGHEIYLAPFILGVMKDGRAVAIDEKNNNKELDPFNIDTKILIYEREVKGWFLDRATNFLRSGDNDFIILMICMSYLEGVEQYRQGETSEGRSKRFFKEAVRRLYPDNGLTDDNLNMLYSESRCGLFHNGMVGGKIILKRATYPALNFHDELIEISPDKLLKDIKRDFNNYIKDLKDGDEELRFYFDRMYNNMV
jgi:hypothetical protein